MVGVAEKPEHDNREEAISIELTRSCIASLVSCAVIVMYLQLQLQLGRQTRIENEVDRIFGGSLH